MRKVPQNFLSDSDFQEWQERAKAARNSLISAKPPAAFQAKVWQDLKHLLMKFNNGKCMFCEGNYAAGAHLDAEHYRPKGGVTQLNDQTHLRQSIDHPGYYWLAYEWHNILLACSKCNGKHPDGEGDKPHPGKLNEFPICGSCRVCLPSSNPEDWWKELQEEKPLLLHPYFDEPEKHFEARRFGVIYGLTEHGRATIETCDLNRPRLRAAREREESNVVEIRAFRFLNSVLHGKDYAHHLVSEDEQFSLYVNLRMFKYVEELFRVRTDSDVTLSLDR